jgi:hypothetical protein
VAHADSRAQGSLGKVGADRGSNALPCGEFILDSSTDRGRKGGVDACGADCLDFEDQLVLIITRVEYTPDASTELMIVAALGFDEMYGTEAQVARLIVADLTIRA